MDHQRTILTIKFAKFCHYYKLSLMKTFIFKKLNLGSTQKKNLKRKDIKTMDRIT